MGIGVTYYGGNVRKIFDVDSVPQEGSDLHNLIRGTQARASGAMTRAQPRHKGFKPDVEDMPGMASEKFSGSLVEAMDGRVCLEGEESGTIAGGNRIYSMAEGKRGWRTIEEIDASKSTFRVGPEAGYSNVEADNGSHRSGGNTGFSFNVVSRVTMQPEDVAGKSVNVLYAFYRSISFTPSGRALEISKEKRQLLGYVMGGGGGTTEEESGWLCVPSFSGDTLVSLTFTNEKESVSHVVPVEGCQWAQQD